MSDSHHSHLAHWVKRTLDFLRLALLALIVIWPLVVLIVGLHVPDDPAERHTDVSGFLAFEVRALNDSGLEAGTDAKGPLLFRGNGDVLLNNTDGRISWFVSGLLTEILALLAFYGLLKIRRLFNALTQGETFTIENARQIQHFAYVVIAWNLLNPLFQYFGSRFTLNEIDLNWPGVALYPSFELNIGGLLAGLALLGLVGVLQEAAEMKQEQSLTI